MPFPVTSVIKSFNNLVVPSDDDLLTVQFGEEKKVTKGIQVGVAGDVNLLFADDVTPVVITLTVGDYPYAIKKVLATNTTASEIYALY